MKPPLGLVLLGVFSAIAIVPALVNNLFMDKESDIEEPSDAAYEQYILEIELVWVRNRSAGTSFFIYRTRL